MLKFIIFIGLIATPYSIDLCNEYQNFSTCISSINEQCKWDTSSFLCKSTTEYLDGCSIYLNKRSCVKQIGTTSGELSKCRFTTLCETIPDLILEVCTSSLSKHGCLSIQNPTALCYWDTTTYTCQTLPNNENYKLNFGNKLYSASVCQHIQGYLVMHSSLLWAQLNYSPNLVKEDQNQFRSDLNLSIDTVAKNYENEQTQLKNNYVEDSSGNFIPYVVGQPLASALTNVKISDREREGCIALQIQDDEDFKSLMIPFDNKLFGVNHIYCRYLFEQTTPVMAVFASGACVKISDPLQLKDQTFISTNQIVCTSMSYKFCSFFYSKLQTCEIPSKTKEFSCSVLVSTLPATYDCVTHTQDIYYICRLNDKCYLDETTFQCTNIGNYSPTDCAKQPLLTIKSEITATMTNFQYCAPAKKCLTFGIGKWYCKNIPYLCKWNSTTSECSDVYMYELNTMKCIQATTKFTCSSVTVAGQHCIWLDEDQLCVNVVENALFMSFRSFPSSLSVNRNLCVNYSQGNYKFNQITRLCEMIQVTDVYTCATAIDVNKEYCLSLKDCKWDERNAICSLFNETGQSCTSLVNVSNTVCRTAIAVPSQFCVYDLESFSCLLQMDIQCTTEGVQKTDCLAITSKGNFCNWINEKCTSIQENYIFSENCYAFQNVNARVCVTHSYSSQPCAYDNTNKNCYSTIVPSATCSNLLNAYACQLATPECYFYEGCQAITDYSFITCEGLFISKAACLKVNKAGQKCYYDTSCKTLDFIPDECVSLGTLGNQAACLSLKASSNKALDVGNYCEYSAGSCVSTTTIIADCGSSALINIHRCGAYSTGQCIFKDSQCQNVVGTTKLGSQYLKTIECAQANLFTCPKVESQACLVTNAQYSTLQVDKRCTYFQPLIDYSCVMLGSMAAVANSSVCSKAIDKCYYNGTMCTAVPNVTTFYKCNQAGLSEIPCLSQTYGKCMFVDYRCQAADDTTECSKRNRWACLDVRKIKCTFKDGLCISSSEDCDIVDRVGYPIVQSWSVCSIASGECYGQQGTCVKASKGLSCNIPGISKKVCLASTSLQLCQYVDYRCQTPEKKSCEESLSIEQCAQNMNDECVYVDGKCFSQGLIDRCDRYEYTNYRFCRQFSKCSYIDQKCVDQSVILDQLKSQIITVTSNCSSLANKNDCLFQLNLRCEYQSNGFCGVSTNSFCPHLLGNNYSKYSCIYFDNCKFGLTKTGGYCYRENQIFNCEDMGQDLCLADISDNYKCVWNGSNCITNTYTTCIASAGIQMNYPACISISTQDSNKCGYQFETQFCKTFDIPPSLCTDSQNQFDIECALIIQQSCYLNNLGGNTYSCTVGTAYNIKLNRFGCIALTGANYYYNEMTYQCTLASDLTLLMDCANLNKNACISITSQLMFYCQWNQSCQNLNSVQNKQLNSCIDLNQNACLKVEKTQCLWNGTACVSASLGVHGCSITSSSYSLGSCASAATEYCLIKLDNTGCDTLSSQIEFCDDLGLSQQACLKNTSKTTCKWNGFCQTANLQNTLCSDTVSEWTCKSIQTPGQYCKWNGTNCSPITPTICTDAVSYASCSIVQTQLCNYNTFTNQCNQINVIPKKCLTTLNKLACRQVDGMNCIWKNDHCIESLITACILIYNKMACLTSPLFCIWQNDTCYSHDTYDTQNSILCKDIVIGANKTVCLYYAKDYCQFNNLKCGVEISDWSTTTATLQISDSTPYTKSFLTGICTDQLSKSDCIRTKTENQPCQWNSPSCLFVTNFSVPCVNLNILACLKSTQNCIWRNEQCFTDTTSPVPDESLDISPSITCITPNISKNTCMAITQKPCFFSDNKCQDQLIFSQMRCDLYTNVNEKVCQKISNLACAYNKLSHQCVDASITDTLSKLACLRQIEKRTYWNEECINITDKFYCDSEFNSNPSSCSITYESIACAYDTINQRCTSKMNLNQLKCDSPGLNQYSCIAITTQPCIFISGKCQLFTSIESNCDQVKIVNALACAYITQDQCYYDEANQQCSQTTIQLPCSTSGLSINACRLNTTCKWSPDQMSCICGVNEIISFCTNKIDKSTCILESSCMYGQFGCKPKNCEDYTKATCPITNMKCFLDLSHQCKSALKCEHITNIDVQKCNSYFFGGYSCIPAGDRCATYNNYQLICPYSDCLNQNCIKDTSCRERQCTDLNPTNCSIIQKCKLIDGLCTELTTCSQFNSDGGQCVITNLNGSSCNYQQYNIYSDEQVCTSEPCAIYGSSSTLCHGNEMADFTCYLDRRLNCKTCEQISDQCTCIEALGICSWQNDSCQSILCSNFESQSTCEQISRCQWSQYWKGCTIHCNKLISQQSCNFRVGECYYNTLTHFCEVGVLTEPDLTVKIDIQVIHSLTLLIPIALMTFL